VFFDKKCDTKGDYYRLGMIERQALTLENYAASVFGSRFYSEDFLKGLSERRNELHLAFVKASSHLFLATTLLAFFSHIEGKVHFLGFTFSIPSLAPLALSVLIATGFLGTVMALIDQLIIDRFVSTLGQRIGVQSFEMLLLNHTAQNLWTMAITPKYFGLESQLGHKSVMSIIGLFYAFFAIIIISYPVTIAGITAMGTLSGEPSLVEYTLLGISAFIWVFALIILFLFAISYKFRPTGLSEPDNPLLPEDFLDLGYPYHEGDSDHEKNQTPQNSTPNSE
jgi:hypothetical protein